MVARFSCFTYIFVLYCGAFNLDMVNLNVYSHTITVCFCFVGCVDLGL